MAPIIKLQQQSRFSPRACSAAARSQLGGHAPAHTAPLVSFRSHKRLQELQQKRAAWSPKAISDSNDASASTTSVNPLNTGPCGEVLSSGVACWVRRTLVWGAVGIGAAVPVVVLLLGDEVRSQACFAIRWHAFAKLEHLTSPTRVRTYDLTGRIAKQSTSEKTIN